MTKEDIKKVIKKNIGSICMDIHAIIEHCRKTGKPIFTNRGYDGVWIYLDYDTFYDSVRDCVYIVNMFDICFSIEYDYSAISSGVIDTHYTHFRNYVARSEGEILLQIEKAIGE